MYQNKIATYAPKSHIKVDGLDWILKASPPRF